MGEPTAEAATDPLPRSRFYYGWVNVGIAAVAMSATLPGRTYGLGLIKEPLRADLGISELRFGFLNFWAIVIGALVVPPVGYLIDRFGTRVVLAGVAAALGGSVVLMSRAGDDRELAITLTLVRGLGQGALSVVAISLVGKWFRRARRDRDGRLYGIASGRVRGPDLRRAERGRQGRRLAGGVGWAGAAPGVRPRAARPAVRPQHAGVVRRSPGRPGRRDRPRGVDDALGRAPDAGLLGLHPGGHCVQPGLLRPDA